MKPGPDTGGDVLVERDTVRLILMDPQQRILLLKLEDKTPVYADQPMSTVFWVTPGGGREAGETFEQALRREVWEEIGLRLTHVGHWVWQEQHDMLLEGVLVRFNLRYYFLNIPQHQVDFSHLTVPEQEVVRDYCWWSLDAMRTTTEILLPPGLPDLLDPLCAGRLPAQPQVITRPKR